jgi:hypothetical protein
MVMQIRKLASMVVGVALASGVGPANAAERAELILTGGHIRNAAGWVDALAVHHGVIVASGDAKAIDALRGPATRVVNLAGGTVLPGLHDVHVHPLFGGISQQRCRIAQGSTLFDTLRYVSACVARAKPGAWVTGGQWDAPALGGVPDRRALDAISGEHAVLLEDTSGHSAWVNSKALAIAGITRSTPNPEGGIIERDAAGDPTGVLREPAALMLVTSHVPRPTAAELQSALRWSLHEMLSVGLTSYTEAAVGFMAGPEAELTAYAALADAGTIKQRARLCITWAPGNEEAEAAIERRNLYSRPRVATDCVKIFLDGVPTDSHTAAMLEPYTGTIEGRDDEAGRKGLLLVKQDVLNAAVTRFDHMGLTVKFHAAGDAAVRAALDAIAAARRANGQSGLMHNVGHCTFVTPADIARARSLGATFEVSPYLWGPTPINDSIAAAVGSETIRRVWPVREMIDAGALVVPGSDWAVVPSVNPWIGIETLATREVPGGSPEAFGRSEAITVAEALDLFTINAARQENAADRLGSLEPGMLADLIVLDQNPYDVPLRRLHDTLVRMTFIGGEQVYTAGDTKSDSRH